MLSNLPQTKEKLLLVEDEALIAISQRKKLENIGYTVVTANTGEDALRYFAEHADIALVLMDIDLGDGIDGTEAAEKILQIRKLPIVFFSSHSEKEIVRKTEAIDSYGFIGKNSEITIIDASIKMALNLFEANKKAREGEEKINALFSAMTEMVVIHDLVFDDSGTPVNYRIVECNDAYSKITGIQKDDAVGKLGTEVYKTTTPPFLDVFSQVALTGRPNEYSTYFEPLDKHFSTSVVSPKKNTFATITTDITGLRRTQNSLNAKNAELENYLYIASHDLRSPLVNIQGFSQRFKKQADNLRDLLVDAKLDKETQSGLDALFNEGIPNTLSYINSNVTKMDTLISGLLRISRTGRASMNIVHIDTGKLLSTIVQNFDFQLTEIHALVKINDVPDCFGDETLLNQLFSNILGNAIKYRDPNRQLTIEISGHSDGKKSNYSFKDNGIGIEENNLIKIWNVFFRVRPDGSETGEGLGLSLVKRIAEKHQGKVWAESIFGEGSTFNIELPANIFSEQ